MHPRSRARRATDGVGFLRGCVRVRGDVRPRSRPTRLASWQSASLFGPPTRASGLLSRGVLRTPITSKLPRPPSDPALRLDLPRGEETRRTRGASSISGLLPAIRGGRYRIDGVLGEGGTAVVYAAHDTVLHRDVALKELRAHRGHAEELILSEARALATVRHPNVVSVYEVEAGTTPYLVMERVHGVTLADCLDEVARPITRALRVLAEAAAGLDAIHAAGLVHGDVKPSNILLEVGLAEGSLVGSVKLTDFGLAPLLGRVRAGDVLGTPVYIAPERVRASATAPLTALGDVYSFAAVAMELLTGSRPFAATSPGGWLAAHSLEQPRRPSEVSRLATSFDAPILRALSKRPEDRPVTCTAFVRELEEASRGADADGEPLRILVVDDDPDIRALFSTSLSTYLPAAIVEVATDGHDALDAVRAHVPDVVLADLEMPRLGGTDALRAITLAAPDASLVVVTGHGSGPEWREARELGAKRFLVKPVDIQELVRAVRAIVETG